jgi:ABC-type glycerol-3-phosphate transport system substrate-binding protein
MNRKHNPLVALVALLLLAVLLLCAGCSGAAAAEEPEEPEIPKRFTIESYDYLEELNIDYITIITDTETGVQYIYVDGPYSGGLTVLQPAPEEVMP